MPPKSPTFAPWLDARPAGSLLDWTAVRVLGAAIRAKDPAAVKFFQDALDRHDGNREKAASDMGVTPMAVYRWLRALDAEKKAGAPGNPKPITYAGRTQSLDEWCKELGITRTIYYRRKAAGREGAQLFAPGRSKKPKAKAKKARSKKRKPAAAE